MAVFRGISKITFYIVINFKFMEHKWKYSSSVMCWKFGLEKSIDISVTLLFSYILNIKIDHFPRKKIEIVNLDASVKELIAQRSL